MLVDVIPPQFAGEVVDPGTGGVMGALGMDPDALMATIEKNKARTAEAAAAAEQATASREGDEDEGEGGSGDGANDGSGQGEDDGGAEK